MQADKLRVAEIFTSIQGEGIWVGMPSTFVRVSGCNLRCTWCDTPYASWAPEGPIMSVAEIFSKVKDSGVNHVVLTGGEPMLFEPVVLLSAQLTEAGHVVTIETAGTIYRELSCDLLSVSPKLANSTPSYETGWRERHEKVRRNFDALCSLIEKYTCQLKFVLESANDVDEVDYLLSLLPRIDPERVMIMAEGVSSGVQERRQRDLVNLCIDRGWRLTPRLHIDLFGDTRGT